MDLQIKLVAALLPAVVLLIYIIKKDPIPEPTNKLVRAVLCGVGICIPVAFLEMFIQSWIFGPGGEPTTLFGTTVNAFLIAAVPEEAAKLFVLWLLLRHNPHFDESFDGVVYAVCVGLGFAAFENIFYVFGQEEGWLMVAISRALLSVPGHYGFAILMGYYYSLYHFVDHSAKNAFCIFLMPVLAHGIYDSIAMSNMVNPYIGMISFCVLVFFCIKLHKVARNKLQKLMEHDNLNRA